MEATRQFLDSPERRTLDAGGVAVKATESQRRREALAFREALTPTVEAALQESVHRDPRILADALFPVMGPAIRKSIAETIRSMLQAFNEALEHSLSIQGLRWRLEAIRTGRPFAEVVLLRSLIYRVEQVFLIHRKTSLLLQHVVAPFVAMQDPDMVSGMLSAIQDFVRDSFRAQQDEFLDSLQVGELNVWVEEGPQAILAAVIRGQAPMDLRVSMKETLEEAHQRFGLELETFEGNAAPFEAFRGQLAKCLEEQYQAKQRKPKPYFLVLILLLIGLLAGWKTLSVLDERKWNRFVEDLRRQPGIVITAFGKQGGRYQIQGLRDPMAADPGVMLRTHGLDPGRAEISLAPYYALDDGILLRRAEALLRPPAGVTLSMENGVLRAVGEGPTEWVGSFRGRAALTPGVRAVDDTHLLDVNRAEFERGKHVLASAMILFAVGKSEIESSEIAKLDSAAATLKRLLEKAPGLGEKPVLEIVGHSDSTGAEGFNVVLSRERADQVMRRLTKAGIPSRMLRARGAASSEPVPSPDPQSELQHNRSVTFRIATAGPPARQ